VITESYAHLFHATPSTSKSIWDFIVFVIDSLFDTDSESK